MARRIKRSKSGQFVAKGRQTRKRRAYRTGSLTRVSSARRRGRSRGMARRSTGLAVYRPQRASVQRVKRSRGLSQQARIARVNRSSMRFFGVALLSAGAGILANREGLSTMVPTQDKIGVRASGLLAAGLLAAGRLVKSAKAKELLYAAGAGLALDEVGYQLNTRFSDVKRVLGLANATTADTSSNASSGGKTDKTRKEVAQKEIDEARRQAEETGKNKGVSKRAMEDVQGKLDEAQKELDKSKLASDEALRQWETWVLQQKLEEITKAHKEFAWIKLIPTTSGHASSNPWADL